MVKSKQELLRKANNRFFKLFARNYLSYLGNNNPTSTQLSETQELLSSTWIRQAILFDIRLSDHEKQCLYLSGQGMGLKEIAKFLDVSLRRITQYRQSIFKKLECTNIASAIVIGIRFGVIQVEDLLKDRSK
jgi:DNA-binding CsgD family transcriptional regulator